MKRFCTSLLLLAFALAVASPLTAADDAPKGKGKGKQKPGAAIMKKLEGANLTADQQEKINAIVAQQAPQVTAAQQAAQLSDEQKTAMKAAAEKAKADGLKGKQAQEAVQAAVKLPDAQQASIDEAKQLQGKLMAAIAAVLTTEQQQSIGLKAGNKKEKKPAAQQQEGEKKQKKPAQQQEGEKKEKKPAEQN